MNTGDPTRSATIDDNILDADKERESEKLANSRDTSSSVSPCPSEPDEPDGRTVVYFDENDKTNPYNWPRRKKLYVVLTGMAMVLNSTMGSVRIPTGQTLLVGEAMANSLVPLH